MWRDALLILASGLTVIMFLQLNSKRLSNYAKAAKGDIGKRNHPQKFFLIFAIAFTATFILLTVRNLEYWGLTGLLAIIAAVLLLWRYALIDVWKLRLSQKVQNIVNVVMALVFLAGLSLMITSSVLRGGDDPLWRRVTSPLIGIAGGIGIHYLNEYVNKKRQRRQMSREANQ